MMIPNQPQISGYTVNTVDNVKMLVGKVPILEQQDILNKELDNENVDDMVFDLEIAKAYGAVVAWGLEKDTDALRIKLGIPTGKDATNC